MTLIDFIAEIEADYAWREDEIRFHHNLIEGLSEQDANKLRRTAILTMYAHFEGYAKFCFEHFVNMINALLVNCGNAKFELAASTLYHVFEDLNRAESKSKIFKNTLPNDKRLNRLSRQAELLERIAVIDSLIVKLPDDIVDTESNLKPVVLRKLLFEVGLDYSKFDHLENKISRLLNVRNDIAHGGPKFKNGIFLSDYNLLRKMASEVMTEVKNSLVLAIKNSEYLR
ncbi:MAE_28990/MAE_18760 family HEPN-like nuclease [Hymenobacter negativus]|uniref:RiboL-PSP-HEPN domain-containing protein n=1 Tax=Hymenobacter negativus TaxID=2795026 RepID=A0ABS3QJL8_9BACT|nr:MAE_28990/MAE_18760 family HEPN-like nuclease [Hymenobacter negativus]MBO2010900.1 hypothetical protein [Hymenobacter negativus]